MLTKQVFKIKKNAKAIGYRVRLSLGNTNDNFAGYVEMLKFLLENPTYNYVEHLAPKIATIFYDEGAWVADLEAEEAIERFSDAPET